MTFWFTRQSCCSLNQISNSFIAGVVCYRRLNTTLENFPESLSHRVFTTTRTKKKPEIFDTGCCN